MPFSWHPKWLGIFHELPKFPLFLDCKFWDNGNSNLASYIEDIEVLLPSNSWGCEGKQPNFCWFIMFIIRGRQASSEWFVDDRRIHAVFCRHSDTTHCAGQRWSVLQPQHPWNKENRSNEALTPLWRRVKQTFGNAKTVLFHCNSSRTRFFFRVQIKFQVFEACTSHGPKVLVLYR